MSVLFAAARLAMLISTGLLVGSCQREAPPIPPQIVFDDVEYDAGKVEQGDEINHTFLFRNEGDLDLHISQVRSSCGCMTGTALLETLKPGDRGEVSVTFNTTSYFGKVTRTTSVLSNDPKKPVARLRISADIGFDVAVDPPEIHVGNVKRGATVRAYPRVIVGAGRDVTLTGVESKNKVLEVGWADAGQSERERRLQLTIKPTAPAGEFREQILVRTSSERRPVVAVPVVGIVEQATEKLLSNQG